MAHLGCIPVLLILHQLLLMTKGDLTLTGYPEEPLSHQPFTFSCTSNETQLSNVTWTRNNVTLFFHKETTLKLVGGVLRNFTISSSDRQFNLTLTQFTTFDTGTTWRCLDQGESSNTLTLARSPDEVSAVSTSILGSNRNYYTLIAVGVVLVVTMVTIAVVCFRRKKDTEPSDSGSVRPVYVISSDDRRGSLDRLTDGSVYTAHSNILPRFQYLYNPHHTPGLYVYNSDA